MDANAIFGVQFVLSLVVFGLFARHYVIPGLAQQELGEALPPLLFPHAFRHVGLAFLVPGVVAEPLPRTFANPAAYGDLAAGVLAIAALVALRAAPRAAVPIVWIFSVVGTLDLLYALARGFSVDAQLSMGATWFVPTFIVPGLLVSHALVFARLLSGSRPS